MAAKDLAQQIGVAPSYLSEIETGKRKTTKGLIDRIAPAFSMTPAELNRELMMMEEEDRMTSPVLREDPIPYGTKRFSPPTSYAPAGALCPDMEALALHLLAEKGRDASFSMLREFTESAQQGDSEAFAKARALLALLPKIK